MKSLRELWWITADELAVRCGTSALRDKEYVSERSESEGFSFFTITLPNFEAGLQKGLLLGRVQQEDFQGWKFSRKLPKFLGGFLDLIFDRNTGLLLDEPDPEAIFAIRQLTLMYAKISLPCSDARVEKAFRSFVEVEGEVRRLDNERESSLVEEFRHVSNILWGAVLQAVDEDVYYHRIIPRHGPGSVVEKLVGNQKLDHRTWTERLDRVFHAGDFLLPGYGYHNEFLSTVTFHPPGAETPVKVTAVPKTLKAPRLIAVEPTHMQYAQQGLMEALFEYTERPFIRFEENANHAYGMVSYQHGQEKNRLLAYEGSISEHLATLDLSEASDRVSNQLVRAMTQNFPNLSEALDACRSRRADVPGHGVIRLAKFASMGSAVTFPIEAMVFLSIVFVGIGRWLSRPVTPALVRDYRDSVSVYGDDIIVPTLAVPHVIWALEAFGAKVNTTKSFWSGSFRESCGEDFYAGNRVTPVRIRHEIPTSRGHVTEIVSLVDTRNQFYIAGLWATAKHLDGILDRILKLYPIVSPESPVLGRVSIPFRPSMDGWDEELHVPLVRGWVVRSRLPEYAASGMGALLKFFLKRGDEPLRKGHLQRDGRAEQVRIKLGWRKVY